MGMGTVSYHIIISYQTQPETAKFTVLVFPNAHLPKTTEGRERKEVVHI